MLAEEYSRLLAELHGSTCAVCASRAAAALARAASSSCAHKQRSLQRLANPATRRTLAVARYYDSKESEIPFVATSLSNNCTAFLYEYTYLHVLLSSTQICCFLQNFCSAEICTTSLHPQGRDLFVHSLFNMFLEKKR